MSFFLKALMSAVLERPCAVGEREGGREGEKERRSNMHTYNMYLIHSYLAGIGSYMQVYTWTQMTPKFTCVHY